ncbi:serine/threonine protein kinase [Acidobacteria bacterium AB60]|nr:serine/threonine protein kinase [Acidobacteria bacterium AB60]
MAFEPGQRVGDYEIVAHLGAGGLGAVYEVRHLISHRHEAMKILLPDQSGTPEMVERFRREVQTLAALEHKNIAQLRTAFYHGAQLAMIMELIRGETLRELRLKAPITLSQALSIMSQVLEALVYAHGLGVVHRDIKPSNIMITASGAVKLLDFGIALTDQGSELTRAGYLLGSVNYMSPEQIGGSRANASSDLYAVGVTLYELLTGLLPITGANNYEIMMGHMNKVPVAPHLMAPMVPEGISRAVMRSLAKDPGQRFRNAGEFLAALQLGSGRSAEVAATAALPPGAVPASPGSAGTRFSSGSGLENLALEDVVRRLANYLGPVAKFVVKKLAAQSPDIDFIYREAAKHIQSDADRAAFLRGRK